MNAAKRGRDLKVFVETLVRSETGPYRDPEAWKIAQYGSLWHSEDVENESKGLWGQTFSGRVAADGTFFDFDRAESCVTGIFRSAE